MTHLNPWVTVAAASWRIGFYVGVVGGFAAGLIAGAFLTTAVLGALQ